MTALREFKRLNPPHFSDGSDPLVAEEWLKTITQHLNNLGIRDGEQRVSLTVFQLKDNVRHWWDVVSQSVGDSWERFEVCFREQYLSMAGLEKLRQQFEELRQGNMSVSEYAQQFTNLSRYAPDLVATAERRCRRFEKGLRPPLRDRVAILRLQDFTDLMATARTAEGNWELTQREKKGERRKSKGTEASTSRGGRKGQKRKSSSPESGPEVLRRSASMGSSKGSRQQTGRSSVVCRLCGQPGHVVSVCPKLSQARTSISGPQPQQSCTGGSRTDKQQNVVCFRCDQPGHISTHCPTRPENTARASTGSTPTQQSHYGQSGYFHAPPS